ncbi:hypothetical protein NDS46_13135 [Paenibacillus thiaminolyticus]|uniref:hypothetical protein n=1 Tax=Paenibacillus thiaminolyticus TaxID=49283 RepID=UPI00232EE510|nr:hypothetical protein [Paenibacillus thiaminolyticus]WCF10725.1 hypothetical protein NDS46_13135 [Paenibacillus thiaminolyticus]
MKLIKGLVILFSCAVLLLAGCSKKNVFEGIDFTKVGDEVIGYLYVDGRVYILSAHSNFPEENLGKQIGEIHDIVDKPAVDGDVVYPESNRKYEIRKGDKIFRVKKGGKLLVAIQTREGYITGVLISS